MLCRNCGNKIPKREGNPVFCSEDCKLEHHKKRHQETLNRILPNVCTATRGAIGELLVCLDLLRQGWEVFRPVSPACSCDLIIMKNEVRLRVEVKSCQKNKKGDWINGKYNKNKYDVLARVFNASEICYEPDIKEVVGSVG